MRYVTSDIRIYKLIILTPWCKVLLEKLTGLQLVKKFPAFYANRRFISALKSVRHLSLSWASPIQSTYPHPAFWRSILILSTHLRLGHKNGDAGDRTRRLSHAKANALPLSYIRLYRVNSWVVNFHVLFFTTSCFSFRDPVYIYPRDSYSRVTHFRTWKFRSPSSNP